ncbi:MAG TPA: choice-of-anchor tandem repeat GloVer-containing protein, partial [Chryseolinea sp.]|nr:choice-of-anchor tandem repeat GloVer-containing protein [Chryseolinea sp.]
MQASNGKIYGMTSTGGANGKGVIFEYDPVSQAVAKKHDFDGANGNAPLGSLVQSSDGKLYGVTTEGGASNNGVLFHYDPQTGVFTKRKDFDGATGTHPQGSLMIASSGKFYGMAYDGGTNSKGTIYEYDASANSITKRYDFTGGSLSGGSPTGNLIQATNGLLYGLTLGGGNGDKGVLFEFNPSNGNFTNKIDFGGSTNGTVPYGSLFQASNGKLYGTTEQGGLSNFGTIFEYNITSGTLSAVVNFDGSRTGNGASSRCTLMQATDGNLYGMASTGGLAFDGVLFAYNPTNSGYVVKLSFNHGEEGKWPNGGLVQGANGKLYGTTYLGGANYGGILFEYEISSGVFTKKLEFSLEQGTNPASGMTRALNGKLYGVTRFGGDLNSGVVFEYDPSTNQYVKKASFGTAMGSPIGRLVQLPDGNFYGVTEFGGNNSSGTLFQFDPATNNIIKKIDFAGTSNGSYPTGSLLYSGSKLYGLTREGGTNDEGVIYEFDPSNGNLSVTKHFSSASMGANPFGNMIKASNNKFYGIARSGGANNWGVIFEYDPSNGNFSKYDFSGNLEDGLDPQGSLIESSNGKLYGTTNQGGDDYRGVLYEYDIVNKIYTKKADFIGSNGGRPYESLLYVSMENQTLTFDELEAKTTTDGPFQLTAAASSGLPVTYTSSNTSVATVSGSTVTIHGAGTTTITAQQTGSINFHASPAIARTLDVTMVIATESFEEIGTYPYPNPANSEFIIELSRESSVSENGIRLYDVLGRSRIIGVEKLDGKKYRCNTSDVPTGLYFLIWNDTQKYRSVRIEH